MVVFIFTYNTLNISLFEQSPDQYNKRDSEKQRLNLATTSKLDSH